MSSAGEDRLDPQALRAWPHREAKTIDERLERGQEDKREDKGYVLLQTGFGPSGLPHIGTFSEVARTRWVQRAYELAGERPTKLFAFSDDMDGMRGVPLDMPDPEALIEHLGKPLCDVPDPFGEHESFSGHMNAKLREFLDSFGFEYEFRSSQQQYRSGAFDEGLRAVVEHYDAIRALCTEQLSDEVAESWSPFKPTCAGCGRNTTTRVTALDREGLTIDYVCDGRFKAKILSWEAREGAKRKQEGSDSPVYYEERRQIRGCGHEGQCSVLGGEAKLGWKVDWALRWYVYDVDYEMYGKDLIDSAMVSGPIVDILGGRQPAGMVYEWFNDEHGRSISKTKGNGLTIDEWLRYAPLESLAYFVYRTPNKSKKLFFGVIPSSVNDFLSDRERFAEEELEEQVNNPIYFVEANKLAAGQELDYQGAIDYATLLNLVSVLNTADREIVWNYILRYDPQAGEDRAMMDKMVDCAIAYYQDFVAPSKSYKDLPEEMMPAVEQLLAFLRGYEGEDSEEIQNAVYTAGKDHDLKLGKWFKALYQAVLGQERGPRMGTFIHLYGVQETLELLEQRLPESATSES